MKFGVIFIFLRIWIFIYFLYVSLLHLILVPFVFIRCFVWKTGKPHPKDTWERDGYENRDLVVA